MSINIHDEDFDIDEAVEYLVGIIEDMEQENLDKTAIKNILSMEAPEEDMEIS